MSKIEVEKGIKPDPVEKGMKPEPVVEHAETSKPQKKIERWISLRAMDHTIIEKVDGKATAIKFEKYSLELDLDDVRDRMISAALRASPRYKRDICVIGERYPDNAVADKNEMMDKLQQMPVNQMLSLVTVAELNEAQIPIPPTESDKMKLSMFILSKKSL